MRRAQHGGMQRSLRHEVGDVMTRAGDECGIFLARERLSEAELRRHALLHS
jgi:hypothetical protein